MDRRGTRIIFIMLLTALAVGVLPVIPVGEVLAPERSSHVQATSGVTGGETVRISPVADASTLQKLRHLFSN